MKFTLHKKIAALFGYEFVRIKHRAYQDINSHLVSLFDSLAINCVLDVGANRGQFVHGIRNAGYTGRVISFEPVTGCYDSLVRQTDDKWQVLQLALGCENCDRMINITHKNVLSSFLEPNEYSGERFRQSANVEQTEMVKMVRLDSVLIDLLHDIPEPRVFLKIDTQGFDLEVLKGACGCLDVIYGLQSEIACKAIYRDMPTHIESLAYIDSLGFEITHIFPLAHDKNDLSLLEFDGVFRRRDG